MHQPSTNILRRVVNCGVTAELKIEEAQIIRLTNLFGIFPMFFFMIYIANGIIYDISFFWQIGLFNALLNILAIWCNYKGYYPAAKINFTDLFDSLVAIHHRHFQVENDEVKMKKFK